MNLLNNLISSGIDKVVDSTMKGLNNLFTSDDERNKAEIVLEQQMHSFKLEMEKASGEFEKEITKRWESDNEHIITRLVRPISYSTMLVMFIAIVLADGNIGTFSIDKAYIPVINTLLATMTISYFGSRGAEKITKAIKK